MLKSIPSIDVGEGTMDDDDIAVEENVVIESFPGVVEWYEESNWCVKVVEEPVVICGYGIV